MHEIQQRSPIKEFLADHPVMKAFIAGSLSGTCSSVLFQPLDLVKTRLQTPAYAVSASNSGMITTFGHIVRQENVLGLWRGITPTIMRCVPGVGLYFSTMDFLKTHLADGDPGPWQAAVIGVMARTLSGVAMIPVTVVKTRYESNAYCYKGIATAFSSIYRSEGIRGLSCGLLPTLIRDAPFSGLYLMVYTSLNAAVPQKVRENSPSAAVHFTCGVFAGLTASAITQPADVLKTKMQLFPNKFHHLSDVIEYVYKKYGYRGYFKGLVPRMLRRTLMAAMAWTVYEQIMKDIGLK